MFKHIIKIFLISWLLFEYLGSIQELMLGEDAAEVFDFLFDPQKFVLWLSTLLIFALNSIFTYIILKKTFQLISKWKVSLYILLLFIIVIGIRYFFQEIVCEYFWGFGNYRNDNVLYYFLDNTYYSILYGSIGALYFFFQFVVESEKSKKLLEHENRETQLSFLRAQVNPHFLFNSLNNIYSLVNQNSEEALPSIEKLSGLMRYSLYEQKEKVSINREISLIEDFIQLEELRVSEEIEMDIQIASNLDQIQISPYLLLPFIENAMKHGDLHNKNMPIQVKLFKDAENLNFEIMNAKKDKLVDGMGGIGLTNIKQRLQLLYGNNHELEIENADQFFKVILKINLSTC